MLRLTREEQAMLDGEAGRLRARAMRHLIEVGAFFDAERLVPVSQAHIMADTEALGEVGVRYLETLAEAEWEDRRVLIPTITDPRGADFKAYEKIRQAPAIVDLERRARDAFVALGVMMTDTCINYQTIMPPVRGEHLAFGDTGVCIYSNSVFGARTNYEGGPSALASALTGRAPEYGFHLDRHRLPTKRIDVSFAPSDLVDWGALGALIGEKMGSYFDVPFIAGIEVQPDSDCLKHLGAAMASYGSTALYHLDGVTPEAADTRPVGDLDTIRISRSDIDAYLDRFGAKGDALDVVVFAAPQLSLLELRELSNLLKDRDIADSVTVLIATSPENKTASDRLGFTATLEQAGAIVLEGVCFYQMHARELGAANNWHTLMTNSAKLTNIITGYGYRPIVSTMERCVASAVAGRVL